MKNNLPTDDVTIEIDVDSEEMKDVCTALGYSEIVPDRNMVEESDVNPWTLYYYSEPTGAAVCEMYLYGEILSPEAYARAFNIFRLLSDKDKIYIFINSPGGDFATLLSFISVLERTPAETHTFVDGLAESAAAVLALVADKLTIGEHAGLMFHGTQTCVAASSAEIVKRLKHIDKIYAHVLNKYCKKLLTKREIDDILKYGKELNLTGIEVIERLNSIKG